MCHFQDDLPLDGLSVAIPTVPAFILVFFQAQPGASAARATSR
jgi:hypothetical protein